MAYSLNKVQLIGNVGKEPELAYSQSGNPYLRFSIATTSSIKDKTGNWVDKTEWHNITVFGKPAETAQKFLKKGSKVFVEGKLSNSEYEKDGVKRYSYNILVSDFENIVFLDKKDASNSSSEPAPSVKDDGEDLPF
ncbi:MAG TPA: single-stranded DNA-binding protein [Bacteroidetes bacterium]|nr:single-stranded DNA-binding protein [Bacteroidota bacterium]HCN37396.1 single-stranded DNA-binding protein [Bacteroidota bacterium]